MKTFAIWILTLALCCCPIWAQRKKKEPNAMPDKPVAASSLPKEKLAAFKAPFAAEVLPQEITGEIGPMSVTSGTGGLLGQINSHCGFEPMIYRPKVRPEADSDRTIHLPGYYANYHEGFWDGARVRVYHPVNGKLTLVRDSIVPKGGHRSSTWRSLRGQLHAKVDATSMQVVFDKNARLNVPYWFMVRAVAKDGTESEDSKYVKVVPTAVGKAKQKRFNLGRSRKDFPAPPTPQGLKAAFADGIATLTWQGVSSEGLAGYRVYYSSVNPETHRGVGIDLASSEPRPDQKIQKDDLVFLEQVVTAVKKENEVDYWQWNRTGFWPGAGLGGFTFWPDESADKSWALVAHPKPLPAEFAAHGSTCLMMRNKSQDPVGINLKGLGGTDQSWYTVLNAKAHTIEAWVRGNGKLKLHLSGPYATEGDRFPWPIGKWSGVGRGNEKLPVKPVHIPLSGQWKKVKLEFTVPGVLKSGLAGMFLTLDGPGEVYIDELRVCESDASPYDFHPTTTKELRESGMGYMRTHELIKTKYGYTLEGMTNRAGSNNYAGTKYYKHTFTSLLNQMKSAGTISPWLQVEMSLNEDEWRGFAEWLAAPYDPAKDSPKTKPWAAKRYALGQKKPWLDEFPRFAFEISNETWNGLFQPYAFNAGRLMRDGATGKTYGWGATYGLLFQYIIDQLRASPYWTKEIETKTEYMICGWAANLGYGADAATHCPAADYVTYAGYNKNAGLGDPAEFNDFKIFYQMQWGQSAIEEQTEEQLRTHKDLARSGSDARPGVYEFGPSYHVGGAPKGVPEIDQRLARSMSAAVYVLDAVLIRAAAGFREQAFFTFGHNTGPWGSHTDLYYGGYGYPKFKAMKLFNHQAPGKFLKIDVNSTPRWDFPEYTSVDNMRKRKRKALPNAPLVSAYASHKGKRTTIFLLSRKLDRFPITGDDGVTPCAIKLPFKKADKVTLYRLTGDPRVDDRFKEHVKLEEVAADKQFRNGGLRTDLPPASIYCYVFETSDFPQANATPRALIGDLPLPRRGRPVTLPNRSSDPDGDQLRSKWTVAGQGELTGATPSVTFDTVGWCRIGLRVDDGKGGSGSDSMRTLVAEDFGGQSWSIGQDRDDKSISSLIAENGRLTFSGGAGRGATAATTETVPGDFTIEVTVEAVNPPGDSRKPARAGLQLCSRPNWRSGWFARPFEAITISSKGSVSVGKESIDGISLPAKLRIVVAAGKASFQVQHQGKWQELHRLEKLPEPIYPALFFDSGDRRKDGKAVFGAVQVSRSD